MRMHLKRMVRNLLVLFILIAISFHIYTLSLRFAQKSSGITERLNYDSLAASESKPSHRPNSSSYPSKLRNTTLPRQLQSPPNKFLSVVDWHSVPGVKNVTSLAEIGAVIRDINQKQLIVNSHLFGPFPDDGIIVAVQVHTRANYLQYLIQSLRKARGISEVLLIFSHDYYSEEVNSVIKTIDFCQATQIYYPHSIQLSPNSFPGQDPEDCTRNVKKADAEKKGCPNAEWQDSYGHYREAVFTQTKQHWWWKLIHILEVMDIGRRHKGALVLLEEDHYVAPDFLHLLQLLIAERKSDTAGEVSLLNLGNYQKKTNFPLHFNKFSRDTWRSSEHNMGMVLFRETWNAIKEHTRVFCTYDDYNWDWTLMHISQKLMNPSLSVLFLRAPRIFHIGECGMHKKGKSCAPEPMVGKVEELLRTNVKYLFPNSIQPASPISRKLRKMKPNGGWGDPRDHNLCLSYSKSIVS